VENALPLFALAAVVAAGALTIRVLADWWLRSKQLDIAERTGVTGASLTTIEARLARIEQVVETTAVEVERIAEAQRYTSKLLAGQQPSHSVVPGRSTERP
jgi:hypothetical protein